MPGLAEILRSLHGAWRLLLLDRRAITAFDPSPHAALRSFWVVVVTLPLYLANTAISLDPTGELSTTRGLLADLVDYALSWVIPLIVFYALVRWYGRGERFWLLVSALNWTQIIQAVGSLIATGLFLAAGTLVDPNAVESAPAVPTLIAGLVALLAMFLFAAMLAYEWYVAWVTLEAGVALPTAAVLFDLVIGIGVSYGIDHALLLLAHAA